MMVSARHRAKKKGLPFSLEVCWAEERLQKGVCEATGIPFNFSTDRIKSANWDKANPLAPSIDRIDQTRGYTSENCQMIVWLLNRAKGHFELPVFRQVIMAYLEKSPKTDDDVPLVIENPRWNKHPQPSDKYQITFNGETMTADAWARKIGVSINTIKSRRKRGWPIEKVLSRDLWRGKNKTVKVAPDTVPAQFVSKGMLTFNSETLSVAEWSRRLGFAKSTIQWRIRQGWSMEDVLSNNDRRFLEDK